MKFILFKYRIPRTFIDEGALSLGFFLYHLLLSHWYLFVPYTPTVKQGKENISIIAIVPESTSDSI